MRTALDDSAFSLTIECGEAGATIVLRRVGQLIARQLLDE